MKIKSKSKKEPHQINYADLNSLSFGALSPEQERNIEQDFKKQKGAD